MRIFNFLLLSVFLFLCNNYVHAQLTKSIDEMEVQYKECQRAKPDSTVCSRLYLSQMDSMLTVVFEKLKAQLSSEEKLALVKDQASWTEKKGKFFKKEDENFVYNLKEGIWTKDMIRFSYQAKASFVLKRIKTLLKQLKD